MKIHIIQHVPFETGALIEAWGVTGGHTVTKTLLYENQVLPALNNFDMLIIMGGPMGANDDDFYDWMPKEKYFIMRAIESGKKVLGVCLGAQILASLLGGRVFPNKDKEIGWFPVSRCVPSVNDLDLPEKLTVFHWHGDTFMLPENSIHLFKSEGCVNQGFLYKNNVLSLQFHLEMGLEDVKKIVLNCGDELIEDKYIQDADYILSESIRFIEMNRSFLFKMLDHFIRW